MNKYTIAERQAIKDRLAEEKYFERDRDLFSQLFPHHPLMSELARVNNVNRLSLCRRMVYQMLQKVDEAAILEWRESGARVAVTLCPENSPESKQVEAPSVPAAPKKNLKAEEFPRINWLDNENPDIQLAILLYDERVNTWKQLCALRADLDDCPEKALAIADFDDRNRMAVMSIIFAKQIWVDRGKYRRTAFYHQPFCCRMDLSEKMYINSGNSLRRWKECRITSERIHPNWALDSCACPGKAWASMWNR